MKWKYTLPERCKGPRTRSGLDGRVMKGKYTPPERWKGPMDKIRVEWEGHEMKVRTN